MDPWHFWIIAAIFLAIIEIFTPGFLAGSIAVGALLGALTAALGADLKIQLIFFSAGVLLSFFLLRPIMLKYLHRKGKEVSTNGEALLRRVGRVSIAIDNTTGEGRVVLDGDDWKAVSHDGTPIPKGEQVEVTKIESIILTVKPIK